MSRRACAAVHVAHGHAADNGRPPTIRPAGRESGAARVRVGHYRSGVHIRFDVPADPVYPGRVAAALSSVRLCEYGYIGAVLAAVGAIGFAVSRGFAWGDQISPLCMAMVVGGLLSMLYSPWVRLRARRRSSRYAVEGAYDITDDVYVGRMPATVIPRRLMSAEDAETLRAYMAKRGLLQFR